ncbi:MAG: PH domain-containing protein [Balneolales bacterium]
MGQSRFLQPGEYETEEIRFPKFEWVDYMSMNEYEFKEKESLEGVPGTKPLNAEYEQRNEAGLHFLSPEAVNAWRITGAISSMTYWIIPLGYGAVAVGGLGWPEWPAYVLGGLFLMITMLEATFIPYIRWKHWRYNVDRHEIELQRGIFVIIRTLIPIRRVQHVDTQQGPVYRQFGLASVTISTAGDTHEIPALSETVADELRLKISEYARMARDDL